MHIIISALECAVNDAVGLLTRTRFHTNAPLYLLKRQRALKVRISNMTEGHHAVVQVFCDTWGKSTVLTLELSEHSGNWLAWGPFAISYGPDYPIASQANREVSGKDIYPMYAYRPEAARHLELRIRARVRPGR